MKKPPAIEAYIIEIAERLWSKHAAVMIGAGFSKNASKKSPNCKPFLNWHELADVFYKKINSDLPSATDNYLNPLKLADEIQASFGRPVLEQILRKAVPDEEYSPSNVHVDLMNLPWNDVFTTNYDTLLERALTKATKFRYDIVLNKEDLVYSQRPRIIKLHGSFPSERPFIISEEDYRTYPFEYAPFVNTVQQSLLENTLCLIGFSGDDPNFLSWIGWIRDNLGQKNSPKIYLIGLLNLTPAQTKLLEQRNIIPIDLKHWLGDEIQSHSEAFARLFSFLTEYGKKHIVDVNNWPQKDEPQPNVDLPENNVEEIREALLSWKKTRTEYPGWVVCPRDSRNKLWANTNRWLYDEPDLATEHDLNLIFWYEILWRLDKCLIPISDDLLDSVEKVYFKYLEPARKNKLSNEIEYKWIEIGFALSRHYREEALFEKCSEILATFESFQNKLSPAQLGKLSNERCLMHLYNFDIPNLKISLDNWKTDSSHPFLIVKKAGLIAELGMTKEAIAMLEEALHQVRSQLNLTPITNDYTFLSQESYILQMLKFIKNADSGVAEIEQQTFTDRWNELKKYKCDPWEEQQFFEIQLKSPVKKTKRIERKSTFDIGKFSTSQTFNAVDDSEVLEPFSFLRFSEDIGIPFRVKNTTFVIDSAIEAARRIAKYSPSWATSVVLRAGDLRSLDGFFDRDNFQRTPIEKLDLLANRCLKLIADLQNYISKTDNWRDHNIGSHYANIVPEILSRISAKCSYETKIKILMFLLDVYNSPQRGKFKRVSNLISRLIRSWPESKYDFLVKILIEKFPIIQTNEIIADEFPDPFLYLNLKYVSKDLVDGSSLIPELLASFKLAKKIEKSAIARRVLLLLRSTSNEQYRIVAAEMFWQTQDKYGWPDIELPYSKSAFLELPTPPRINISEIARAFLNDLKLPNRKTANGIQFGGKYPEFTDLIGFSEHFKEKIYWTTSDAKHLLEKYFNWWENEKGILQIPRSFFSRRENDSYFIKATEVLARAIIPFLSDEDFHNNFAEFEKIAEELEKKKIPSNFIKVAILKRKPDFLETILPQIKKACLDNEWNNSITAIRSLTLLLEAKLFTHEEEKELIAPIIEAIKWRKTPALIGALASYSVLIEKNLVHWKKNLAELLFGLQALAKETEFHERPKDGSVNEDYRLQAREKAARLANTLYCKFIGNNEAAPEELKLWHDICQNKEEFAEIRMQWTNCKS